MDISYIIDELGEERETGNAGGVPAEGPTLANFQQLTWTSHT